MHILLTTVSLCLKLTSTVKKKMNMCIPELARCAHGWIPASSMQSLGCKHTGGASIAYTQC